MYSKKPGVLKANRRAKLLQRAKLKQSMLDRRTKSLLQNGASGRVIALAEQEQAAWAEMVRDKGFLPSAKLVSVHGANLVKITPGAPTRQLSE